MGYQNACYIDEGQFQNGILNGFGKRVFADGQYSIGWFEDYSLHGYGKFVDRDGTVEEGLFESGTFVENKKRIKRYDPIKALIAQKVNWDYYTILPS